MLNFAEAIDRTHERLTTAIIRDPLVVVAATPIRETIALMSAVRSSCETEVTPQSVAHQVQLEARASCVIVVEAQQVVGILTERDVVRLCANRQLTDAVPVGQVMTASVRTLREAVFTDLFAAVNFLQQNQIRHVPVVDDEDGLVGLVTHETLRQVLQPTDLLRLRLVREVMTQAVITAAPTDSLLAIAQALVSHCISSVVIVEREHPEATPVPIGIVTERDLVQFQALELDFEHYQSSQVMSHPVVSVAATETLVTVQQLMERYRVRRVVVLGEAGELGGIVTQTNILQALSPLELYKLTELLESRVKQLEAEKLAVLQSRNQQLEVTIATRTANLQKQLQREQIVSHMTSQIRASLSLPTLLATAVEQIHQVMGCDRVNIWKFEADWSTVVVAESTHSAHSLLGQRVQDECYQHHITAVYRQGHIRVVPDIYTAAMTDCHRELLISLHTRAKVLLPLFFFFQLWGLLNVAESYTARDWQPEEIDLLRNLANQLTIAIQQAATHTQLQAELQDRQQTEAQLRQSAERLQEAQRIAQIGDWEMDLQHNTLQWSAQIYRIFEIDPQRFGASYEAFLQAVHPDDRAAVDAAYSQHLRDRQPYNLVHRLLLADGRIKYVREQCETTYGPDGTPLISRGTVQDITQQQVAEMRRDRAEASLRQVIEGTAAFTGEAFFPALVRHIATALDVRYVSVSQAIAEGFQVLAFFADGELCPPSFLPYEAAPCCQEALQSGSCCYPAAVQTLYPDTPLFTDLQIESYLGVRLQNAAGEPTGNLCVLHDRPLADPDWAQTLLTIFAARAGAELERLLTAQALEHLNAELEVRVAHRTAELAEREALLQDFLDNANDLIQIVDIDTGHFEFVNQAWRNVLGYTAAEVETLTCFDVLTSDFHPHCQDVLEAMRSGHLTHLDRVELTFVSKSGQRIVVEGNINCRFATGSDGNQWPVSTRGIFRDITAKKIADQELQRRETRYRGLMEGAPDAILLADLQGNILEGNQKAVELLGYALAELTTLHFTQLHPAAELHRVMASFAEMTHQKRHQVLDITCQRADGSTVAVDITATVIDLDGESLLQGIFHDISERKGVEQALRESRQFLQTVLNTVPLAVFWKDRDFKYLGANQHFLQDAGLSSVAELVGQTDFDMPWATTEAEAYQADDRAVMASGEARLGIVETLHQSDGSVIWLETNKLPLRNLAGEVIGVLGTYQDISDRRQAELALRESETRFRRVFASNVVGMMFTDFSGQIIDANDRFLDLIGYSRADLEAGRINWAAMTPPEYVAADQQAIAQLQREGEMLPFEKEYQRPDGRRVAVLIGVALLSAQDGRCVCVVLDISDRKAAEAILHRTNVELERATRLKDEFLASMSHELRTPLNAILGLTEGLQEEVFGIVNERQLKALRTVEKSGTHLLALINDILDVAKIEAGKIELTYSSVAVEHLCSSSLAFVRQQALKQNIQLQTQIPPHLPDLYVDEIRLRQVLLNLLTNAVKFTPEGGTVTLSISRLPSGIYPAGTDYLRIAVTDTGIGIAPENIARLFQPFVQIDSALNRQYAGTGLGLALVKQIVELHGGQVGLTSELGVGSCFTVDLPYAPQVPRSSPAVSAAIASAVDRDSPKAYEPATTPPLVLLAEDHPANVATIAGYLEARGYRLLLANNGQAAIDLALAHHPDVILMDIQMPGMDGLEAMKHIRQQASLQATPIIALTALAMQSDQERCLAAGANHYLSKPVRLKQLHTVIQALIANRPPGKD